MEINELDEFIIFAKECKRQRNKYNKVNNNKVNNNNNFVIDESCNETRVTKKRLFKTVKVTDINYNPKFVKSDIYFIIKNINYIEYFNSSILKFYVDYCKNNDNDIVNKNCEASNNTVILKHYNNCIEILNHHNILVNNYITHDIRNVVCGNNILFDFNCTKNQYDFTVRYMFGCDRCGRSLYVNNVINTQSFENISCECDLKINPNSVKLTNFLMLLDQPNFNQFRNIRHGKLFEIPKILEEWGYTVEISNNYIDNDTNINVNYNMLVTKDKKSLILFQDQSKHDSNKYGLYLCPNIEICNEKLYRKYKQNLKINFFNEYIFGLIQNYEWEINYDDIDLLPDIICQYHSYLDGKYGYYNNETKVYQNDELLKDLMSSYDLNINVKYKKYNTSDIDVVMLYKPKINIDDKLFEECQMGSCYYDIYHINFKYNSDEKDCVLEIRRLYYDISLLYKDYNVDPQNFNFDQYVYPYETHLDIVSLSGSFDECHNKLTYFLDSII
jgi:hypothetical protein